MGNGEISKAPTIDLNMFHKAIKLNFKKGTVLEVTFQSGEVKQYDIANMFEIYPPLKALNNRDLFCSGYLATGGYGIIWNDDLDLDVQTVYEEGTLVRRVEPPKYLALGQALLKARAEANMSQVELAQKTGIDQSDISKIERGVANASFATLQKLSDGLGSTLEIKFNISVAEAPILHVAEKKYDYKA